MNNIFVKDPKKNINYLKPATLKRLLVTVGIKLFAAVAGMLALPAESYAGFSGVILFLLFFAFVYDICCLYQVCLHITQSILIGFALFLVITFGFGIAFQYGSVLFLGLAPATPFGENVLMSIMTVVFLIPFFIDIVRLIKLLADRDQTA